MKVLIKIRIKGEKDKYCEVSKTKKGVAWWQFMFEIPLDKYKKYKEKVKKEFEESEKSEKKYLKK